MPSSSVTSRPTSPPPSRCTNTSSCAVSTGTVSSIPMPIESVGTTDSPGTSGRLMIPVYNSVSGVDDIMSLINSKKGIFVPPLAYISLHAQQCLIMVALR